MTTVAPALSAPQKAMMVWGRLGSMMATLSPVFSPCSRRAAAKVSGLFLELPVVEGQVLEDDGLVVAETVGSFVQIGLEGTGDDVEMHGSALGNVGQPCGSRGVHEAYPGLE